MDLTLDQDPHFEGGSGSGSTDLNKGGFGFKTLVLMQLVAVCSVWIRICFMPTKIKCLKTVLRIRDFYPRSLIPDPDFYPSRIPNPKTASKERGGKKFVVISFFVATNFTKLKIILFLKC
jgi:hypothetical protein